MLIAKRAFPKGGRRSFPKRTTLHQKKIELFVIFATNRSQCEKILLGLYLDEILLTPALRGDDSQGVANKSPQIALEEADDENRAKRKYFAI